MATYYEFVGGQREPPLVKVDASRVPVAMTEGKATVDAFHAATEADVWRGFSPRSDRFKTGPGPMNVRPLLKWNDEGDHLVHVWVFPRYVWSS